MANTQNQERKTTKRKFFIFLFILFWLAISLSNVKNSNVGWFLGLVLGFLMTLLLALVFVGLPCAIYNSIKNSAKRNKKIKEDMKAKGIRQIACFAHVYGLSIAENVICKISDYEDKYNFEANGVNFNLDKSKITDVCIKTDTEIQHQSVSSVGGAIAGRVLFGPLGAIIGGRAKTRKVKTTTQYLIFTYISNEEIKYICFDISSSSWAAKEMVMAYNLNKKVFESKTIDL